MISRITLASGRVEGSALHQPLGYAVVVGLTVSQAAHVV